MLGGPFFCATSRIQYGAAPVILPGVHFGGYGMRTIHRVCFDFTTVEGALTFWDSIVDTSRGQRDPFDDTKSFEDCHLVHLDGAHDCGKHVRTYLVRGKDPGNGRPLKISTVPAVEETLTIER